MGDVLPAMFPQGGYGEGSGHDTGPSFGYQYDGSYDNALNQDGDPILDSHEADALNDFFDDPNNSKVAASLSQRADSNFGLSVMNYTHDSSADPGGTINPASTMAGPSPISYQPVTAQPTRMQAHPGNQPGFDNQVAADSTDVINTASSLMNMHTAQGYPPLTHGNPTPAMWGNMMMPNYPGNGAMTPNGHMNGSSRQSSSGSSHGFQMNPNVGAFVPQQSWPQDMQAHAQAAQAYDMYMRQQQPQRYGLQHVRTNSVGSNVQNFPHHMQQMVSPTGRPHRVPHMHYDSDPNITGASFGYNSTQSAPYHGKEDNLMQIPFVTQAAHAHPIHSQVRNTTRRGQRPQHVSQLSSAFRSFNSTNSSPTDGLPTPSMTTPTQQHPMQWGALRIGGGGPQYMQGEDDEDALAQSQARKRRKSHANGEDDAEYEPESRTNSKRGHEVVPKVESTSDDEDIEPITPVNTSTAKRRRSTVTRTISGSSPNSPAGAASSGNGAGSSSRRKSSAKSRQNLSDEQKRQNHIISEQKRRNVIKQGYHDLDNLVPILNGGKSGLSKAEQVKEIVAYLERLVNGNKLVEAKLRAGNNSNTMNEYQDDAAGGSGPALPS